MRILVISNYYPPLEVGGWEQLTYDVATRLKRRGHAVSVLASRHRRNELTRAEAGVQRVLPLENPAHGHYRPAYTLAARRWSQECRNTVRRSVAEFRPDVVFVNGMWNLPVDVAVEAERCRPRRVVYYMAGYWPLQRSAHRAYWQDPALASGKRWLKHATGSLVRRAWLPAMQRDRLAFHRVLCVSAHVQRRLVQEANIPAANTAVVHNGIDLDAFAQRERRRSDGVCRLLYAGSLTPAKGADQAVTALTRLRARRPDLCWRLTIAGDGPADFKDALRAAVAAGGLGDRVTFTGWLPYDAMPALMAEHDAFLFTSVWEEPLARVVQEAMATGLTVIGTTVGGMPEILRHEQTGLAWEPHDVDGLAASIERIVAEPDLGEQIADRAREQVRTRFTIDRMVDEIETQLYATLNESMEKEHV